MLSTGERIKSIRKAVGMNQQQFADTLSVSRSFISRVESDKEIPSDTLIKLISLTFQFSYDWIKSGNGEMKNELQKRNLWAKEYNDYFLEKNKYSEIDSIGFSKCFADIESLLNNKYISRSSKQHYIRYVHEFLLLLSSKLKFFGFSIKDSDGIDVDLILEKEEKILVNEFENFIKQILECIKNDELDIEEDLFLVQDNEE